MPSQGDLNEEIYMAILKALIIPITLVSCSNIIWPQTSISPMEHQILPSPSTWFSLVCT